jgi:hypothetical protein
MPGKMLVTLLNQNPDCVRDVSYLEYFSRTSLYRHLIQQYQIYKITLREKEGNG